MASEDCKCAPFSHMHVPDVACPDAPIRTFETGATRDTDAGKLDFEGFLSPLVLERYAEYMDKNRRQRDGTYRDSDNWQKGIPLVAYAKSLWRHFFKFWKRHRGWEADESLEDSLCGVLFNASGYLHEELKAKQLGVSSTKMANDYPIGFLRWTDGRYIQTPAYDQHIGAGYQLGEDAE